MMEEDLRLQNYESVLVLPFIGVEAVSGLVALGADFEITNFDAFRNHLLKL